MSATRPKLIAALLAAGIVVLGGGSILAATRPTWRPSKMVRATARPVPERLALPKASLSTVPPITLVATRSARIARLHARPQATAHARPRPTAASRASSITYTVKPGDTLSGVAEWFKLHGYGSLYAANRAVIGSDPNLIIAGERITISHGVMTMWRPGRRAG